MLHLRNFWQKSQPKILSPKCIDMYFLVIISFGNRKRYLNFRNSCFLFEKPTFFGRKFLNKRWVFSPEIKRKIPNVSTYFSTFMSLYTRKKPKVFPYYQIVKISKKNLKSLLSSFKKPLLFLLISFKMSKLSWQKLTFICRIFIEI